MSSAGVSSPFLVFALCPCSVLDDAIQRAKSKTKAIAGPQIYLDHPPHLTLYVSAFESAEQIVDLCRELGESWVPPQFTITGWNHFSGDVLTGNVTLVCEISEPGRQALRTYQQSLIEAVSPHRDASLSLSRYADHFGNLSAERQKAVQEYGFPFVGADWIPHFTIASIDPASWPCVQEQLATEPPIGMYRCPQLSIFRLVDDFPTEWQTVAIE